MLGSSGFGSQVVLADISRFSKAASAWARFVKASWRCPVELREVGGIGG